MKPENNSRAEDIFKHIAHYNDLIELAKSIKIEIKDKGWMGCYNDLCKVHDLFEEAERIEKKVIKKINVRIADLKNELKRL